MDVAQLYAGNLLRQLERTEARSSGEAFHPRLRVIALRRIDVHENQVLRLASQRVLPLRQHSLCNLQQHC